MKAVPFTFLFAALLFCVMIRWYTLKRKAGKKDDMRRRARWILLITLICIGLLTGCSKRVKPLQEFRTQYLDYFDTFTSVTVYAENEEKFREYEETIRSSMERYHQLFDIYNQYKGISNIKTINDSAGIAPVETDPAVIELLERSIEMYDRTDGKVNPAMGSVLSIWHEYRTDAAARPERAEVPDLSELQKAAQHMAIHEIEIDKDKNTVYLPDPKMKLDVGAVAKGYAAQKICEELREKGVTSALLSLGGNVQTIGTRGDGKPWRVGIQNPDTASQKAYLHAVKLQDMALVTSGSYQRFYEVDGVRYHHIIDPDTLMPQQMYDGVTILCEDGTEADALSTAVFNMELEEGKKLIESLEGTEAIWVFPDGTEVFSSGFEAYVDE